mmetsp:Transcript_32232/g.96641  ORF Transcript_32232/g.96641 Transcript_32232/m.96641 type:complete len:117 (+) Transcript_32232:739-1089(+)
MMPASQDLAKTLIAMFLTNASHSDNCQGCSNHKGSSLTCHAVACISLSIQNDIFNICQDFEEGKGHLATPMCLIAKEGKCENNQNPHASPLQAPWLMQLMPNGRPTAISKSSPFPH